MFQVDEEDVPYFNSGDVTDFPSKMAQVVWKLLNAIWKSGYIPSCWRRTSLVGGEVPNKHHLLSPPLDLNSLLDNIPRLNSVSESLNINDDRKIIPTF